MGCIRMLQWISCCSIVVVNIAIQMLPEDTGRKLNVRKTFSLRPVSTGLYYASTIIIECNRKPNLRNKFS